MKKIKEFYIEEDKKNKGSFLLIAVCEDGEKFVVSGSAHAPMHLVPYDNCWYTKEK